ncbi:hypothetical protein PV646_29655 [Streptomyces sp. ID05-26A]|nr:hypothetical protein [Streptomyces sp. ID05-26A]
MTQQEQQGRIEDDRGNGSGVGKVLGIAVSVVTLLGFFGIAKFTDIFSARESASTTMGSTTSSTSLADTVDRASYIVSADAICRKWFEKTAEIADGMPESLEKFRITLNIFENMLTEWQAIPPPASDSAEVDSIIQESRRSTEVMRNAESALRGGDRESTLRFIERASQVSESNQQRALAYGFRICS